jgi:hypothetical protein
MYSLQNFEIIFLCARLPPPNVFSFLCILQQRNLGEQYFPEHCVLATRCCTPYFPIHELVPHQNFVSHGQSHVINYVQSIILSV